MRPLLSSSAVAGLLCAAVQCLGASPPATPPTPKERHDAQCSAVLDASAETLARQVRAGKKELRREVQETLQAGAAFFAAAYLEGGAAERRVQRLVTQARQAPGPAAELAGLHDGCLDEGRQLFLAAGGLERAVVSRRADQRLQRLLGAAVK